MDWSGQLHLQQTQNYIESKHKTTLETLRNNVVQVDSVWRNQTECFYNEFACAKEMEELMDVLRRTETLQEQNNVVHMAISVSQDCKDKSQNWQSSIKLNSLNSVESLTDTYMFKCAHCCNPLQNVLNKHAKRYISLNHITACKTSKVSKRAISESVVDTRDAFIQPDSKHSPVSRKKWNNIQYNHQNISEIETESKSICAQDKSYSCFRSARQQLALEQEINGAVHSPQAGVYGKRKVLGSRPKSQCFAKFIPPSSKNNGNDDETIKEDSKLQGTVGEDLKIKGVEPQLVELVMSEIMDNNPSVHWNDIAGLEYAKETIKEIVVWPLLRPDIFTGLRGPPKGILLFGPPGTGKTLIGKCIASQSGATFFSISASSLTSKWIGQGEKMVRALFSVAKLHQPAVIFIDEIDSLLSQRSDTEHESSRRIKTEFFVQLDGATTSSEDRILVVGATNRPQEIDEAARRRLVKRLYIPLPDSNARKEIVAKLLSQLQCNLSDDDLLKIVQCTEGYSGADVTNLCKEAALGPIRSLKVSDTDFAHIHKDEFRPIQIQDFEHATMRVRPSVSQKDLMIYQEWNETFGCGF